MQLAELVTVSARVAATRRRNEKRDLLAELIRRLPAPEIEIGVAYLAGRLPQGKVGIGPAQVRGARGVAAAPSASLTLGEVDRRLTEIATMRGAGSPARRVAALEALLARATSAEQELLARLLVGELRQGALEGVLAEAVAAAAGVPPAAVRRALMLAADLGAVARRALVDGEAGLASFDLEVGRPVQPMLAQTAGGVEDALERLGRAAFEWKLDGARIQVHKAGDTVRLFTRQGNDVGPALPELVERFRALAADDLILDGEAIALDDLGAPLPFQQTMRRFGRRLDVERMRAELPVRAFCFDCLRLDGRTLLDAPTEERSAALSGALPEDLRVPRLVTGSVEEARRFYDAALELGHEGVMAKGLEAPYEAGSRGAAWLKVKAVHTLDLVVLAAEWGAVGGKGWLSNLHLGARDPASGGFVMLGKTFKGLTDALLTWQTRELLAREVQRDRWTVYVRPELVVEIAFNDVQVSPHYPGGLALRFARVRRYRTDKTVAEADTIDTVRALGPGDPSPPGTAGAG